MNALPRDDIILPFEVGPLDVRGRVVSLGGVTDTIISHHDYPDPVAALLSEAVALTSLLGTTLKFDGKFILQTKSDGPVGFIVVDFTSPGALRGLARFDAEAIQDNMAPADLLGAGHLAMTIDQGGDMERYQGVVALEDQSLSEAAHDYFRQSEQIPTMVKLAAAPIAGTKGQGWRAGGILLQYLPEYSRSRTPDLPPGDVPEAHEALADVDDDDNWTRAKALLATIEDHELLDPTLSAEQLLYRLYHEDGVRVFEDRQLEYHCHCSRARTKEMLAQFSDEDRRYMIKDGLVEAVCEFCNTPYRFEPAELD